MERIFVGSNIHGDILFRQGDGMVKGSAWRQSWGFWKTFSYWLSGASNVWLDVFRVGTSSRTSITRNMVPPSTVCSCLAHCFALASFASVVVVILASFHDGILQFLG